MLSVALFSVVGCSNNKLPSGNVSYLCVAHHCDTPNGVVDERVVPFDAVIDKADEKHASFNYYRLNDNQDEIIGVRKGTILESYIDKNKVTPI